MKTDFFREVLRYFYWVLRQSKLVVLMIKGKSGNLQNKKSLRTLLESLRFRPNYLINLQPCLVITFIIIVDTK